MATSLKISDEPLFTADDPRFREEMIWQYSANCAQAKVNKSGWATKKTHNPIEWTEAAPAPRQLERVAEAEARAEADRRKRVAAMVQLAENRSAADYVAATRMLHATGRALAEHMTRYDVILSPTMAAPPQPLGVLSLSNPDRGEQTRALLQTTGYTQLGNITGNPAMSVPLHWNSDGLPIGIQFMGRIDDEATLYRLAGQLEREQPWWGRRAGLA